MKSTLTGSLLLAICITTPAAAHLRAIDLYDFDQQSGYVPNAGVITDAHGTIFGTNFMGGQGDCGGAGCGTVFALYPQQGGQSWTLQTLYYFQGGQDGEHPGATPTLGPDGSVFGSSTNDGGAFGTVFQLLPPAKRGGQWTFQILYAFSGGADGDLDTSAPMIWQDGALYGLAYGGSKACGDDAGCGSVFELAPPQSGNGPWTETTLFSFTGGSTSGIPSSIVGFDAHGALYVSTAMDNGAVVQLTPSGGTWNETVIAKFKGGKNGAKPYNLILAQDGTLYGLANTAGVAGLAFQLTPPGNGHSGWTRTNIATIDEHRSGPNSLAQGANGTLIGTIYGDPDFFPGAVFQLTPPDGSGKWTFDELWDFNKGPDRNPLNVVTGRGGHFFGVLDGGDSTNGSLYELR
jgi:hypothetical protein